jgi:predicted transcriptional regulator
MSLVSCIKEIFHPNAYLQRTKNVKNGLKARTTILDFLEKRSSDAVAIAKETSLSYGVVMHHLRLLKNEGTVDRKGTRPYFWLLTGLGQKRLVR